MLSRLRRLAPFAQGLLGILVGLALWFSLSWLHARYTEFVVMRQVIANTIEAQQKAQQTAQPPQEAP